MLGSTLNAEQDCITGRTTLIERTERELEDIKGEGPLASFILRTRYLATGQHPPSQTILFAFVLSTGTPFPPTCPKRNKTQMKRVGVLPERVNSLLLL